jgi:hypothetical protein
MTTVSDTFTYSDGELGSTSSGTWVKHTGGGTGGNASVASNAVVSNIGGAECVYHHSTALASADHYAELVVTPNCDANDDTAGGPMVRATSTTSTARGYFGWYGAITSGTSPSYRLYSVNDGTFTLLGSAVSTTLGTRTIRAEANGSTIRMLAETVEQVSVTNTTWTSQTNVGFYCYDYDLPGTALSVDNFDAADLAVTVDVTGTPTDTRDTATGAAVFVVSSSGAVTDVRDAATGVAVFTVTSSGTSTDTVDAASGTGTASSGTPTVPQNLVATAIDADSIGLTWDAFTGAVGYDIERDSVIIVIDHPTNSYTDTGLDPSTEYAYRVRAELG